MNYHPVIIKAYHDAMTALTKRELRDGTKQHEEKLNHELESQYWADLQGQQDEEYDDGR